MKHKIFEILNKMQLLLIIDNIEDSLRKDKVNLREFLVNILEKLPNIKILATSRD